jgi:cellobiose PTS system EIIB component
MRKIILFCSAGMSTSALVRRMEQAAKEMGYECEIEAHSVSETIRKGVDADVVLLGPQVRFSLEDTKKKLPGKPVDVIDMRVYGTMNGKAVIEQAKALLGDE